MQKEPQVLIIGAGPAGMATAACLAARGIPHDLVDARGTTGGAYLRIHGPLVLASPARYTGLPGLPPPGPGEYVTAAEYRAYLERYAEHHRLSPRAARVSGVTRAGSAFRARFADGSERAYARVVAATGMADHPALPAIPGIEPYLARADEDEPGAGDPGVPGVRAVTGGLQVLHSIDWGGAAAWSGRRVLVIGRGVSGIEIAEDCARQGVDVTISTRDGRVRPLPQRLLGRDIHDVAWLIEKLPRFLARRHCAERPAQPGIDRGFGDHLRQGRIRVRGPVARIEPGGVVFAGPAARVEPFDAIVLATGFTFATPFLPAEVTREPAGHPRAHEAGSVSWPGLHLVGFPCARTLASEFLRGMAEDAPVVADRIARDLR